MAGEGRVIEEEVKRGGIDGGTSKTQEAGTLLKIPVFEEDGGKRKNPWGTVTADGAPCGDLLFDLVFASNVEEGKEAEVREKGMGWIKGAACFEVGKGLWGITATEKNECQPEVQIGRRAKGQTLLVTGDGHPDVAVAFGQPSGKLPPQRRLFPVHRLQSPATTLEIARLHGPLRLRQIHGRDNWLRWPGGGKVPGRLHLAGRKKQQPKRSGQCRHSQKNQHRNPDPLAPVHPVPKKSQKFHPENCRRVSRQIDTVCKDLDTLHLADGRRFGEPGRSGSRRDPLQRKKFTQRYLIKKFLCLI
jgi:hypothetical protein